MSQAPDCKVLVVEDDTDCREVLAMVLEDDGCAVTTASNGVEALSLLEEGLEPDVILLDLRMPVMDGWSFATARKNQALARNAALVVMSSEPAAASASLRPTQVLRKPLEVKDLSRAVRRHCRRSDPCDRQRRAGRRSTGEFEARPRPAR